MLDIEEKKKFTFYIPFLWDFYSSVLASFFAAHVWLSFTFGPRLKAVHTANPHPLAPELLDSLGLLVNQIDPYPHMNFFSNVNCGGWHRFGLGLSQAAKHRCESWEFGSSTGRTLSNSLPFTYLEPPKSTKTYTKTIKKNIPSFFLESKTLVRKPSHVSESPGPRQRQTAHLVVTKRTEILRNELMALAQKGPVSNHLIRCHTPCIFGSESHGKSDMFKTTRSVELSRVHYLSLWKIQRVRWLRWQHLFFHRFFTRRKRFKKLFVQATTAWVPWRHSPNPEQLKCAGFLQ